MTVLLDGAMGTELARRGFELRAPAWSARATTDASAQVLQIHREAVEAGAQVVRTNTFSLTEIGRGDAETAVALVREAIAQAQPRRKDADRVAIAGSIGARAHTTSTSESARARSYAESAQALADAGCDIILVETLIDVADARCAVAAITDSRLTAPLWLSVACGLDGQPLGAGACAELPRTNYDALLVGCTETAALQAAIAATPQTFGGWRGVAPSTAKTDDGEFVTDGASPDAVAEIVAALAEHQDVVGGCCGTTPAWLQKLAALVHPTQRDRDAGFAQLDQHLKRGNP